MRLDVRHIQNEELVSCERIKAELFGIPWSDERLRDVQAVREVDRMVGAFHGTEVVATLASSTHTLSTPGGTVPAAGISGLAITDPGATPTLSRALFARQLDDAHRRGEPVACLCALSDAPPVYSAFGFAVATQGLHWILHRRDMPDLATDPLVRVETIPPEEWVTSAQPVFTTLTTSVPGIASRSHGWWQRNAPPPTGSVLAIRAVVDASTEGYALAHDRGDSVLVTELAATSFRAQRALWAHLLDQPRFTELHAWHRTLDEPLQYMLTDPRTLRRRVDDGMWLRIVDVPAALRSRHYQADADLVLTVVDEFRPQTGGRFRLEIHDGSVTACARTDRLADLELTADALSAAYLGGFPLTSLAHAGRAVEYRAGALAALEAAMITNGPRPWALTRF